MVEVSGEVSIQINTVLVFSNTTCLVFDVLLPILVSNQKDNDFVFFEERSRTILLEPAQTNLGWNQLTSVDIANYHCFQRSMRRIYFSILILSIVITFFLSWMNLYILEIGIINTWCLIVDLRSGMVSVTSNIGKRLSIFPL